MHGGTTECLRGFGYRPARNLQQQRHQHHHQGGRSRKVCHDGKKADVQSAEKGMEKGQRSSASSSSETNADGVTQPPSLPTPGKIGRKRFSSCANTGSAARVIKTSPRQSRSGLERTSALTSSSASRSGSKSSGAAGGAMGTGSHKVKLLSTNSAPMTAAAAFEEDGRPQTAGTASG